MASQIDPESESMLATLFTVFHNCRPTVAFWLKVCVFPKDMKQY